MKILAINGSYRGEKGLTAAFLDLMRYGAEIGGAEFKTVHLTRYKVNRCLGCDTCHTPDHYLSCVYHDKDDAAQLIERVSQSDLVIYATPVYVFGISSLLKAFLDRYYAICDVNHFRVTQSGLFFHHVNENVCSKPFVSLVCCDNLEDSTPQNARDYFRTFGRFMDAPQVGELTRNALKFFGRIRERSINEIMPKTGEVYEAFQQAGYELAALGKINRKTQRKANQEIIPVPGFRFFKRMRGFKDVMVMRAQELLDAGRQ